MGPDDLDNAMPRGGQMADDFPARLTDYLDGRIKQHWAKNRVVDSNICDPSSVTLWVRFLNIKFILLLINIL